MASDISSAVESVYRTDWGKIVATLIRQVGDFEMAGGVAPEAFAAALRQLSESGIPDVPVAWIIRAARNKAIDRIRRQSLHSEKIQSYVASGFAPQSVEPDYDSAGIPDERLRLIFT